MNDAEAPNLPALTAQRALLAALLTAAAYAAVGWLALRLALPPSYASPMYPSAGIALAAALVYGRAGIAGAGIGALLANLSVAAARGPLDMLPLLVLPAAVGLGAALQAAAGAALVRRLVGLPLTLWAPREILRFSVAGGVVACLVNTAISTAALHLAGVVATEELAFTAWTWWLGDTLGVLIGAPIALTLIGRPRSEWAPRRLSVALPMLVGTLLLAAAVVIFGHWEQQRLQETFERAANRTGDAAQAGLEEVLHALQAVHGALAAAPEPTGPALRRASEWWRRRAPELQAVGYSERVPRSELAAFEARARADGLQGFQVFDRPDGGGLAATDDAVVAIRLIEPLDRNATALGVNAMSIPATRAAIEQAARSGEPASTRGFRLTQSERDETGVVVYRALYHGEPQTEAERMAAFRGVVFVTLRLDPALRAALRPEVNPLRWCVLDPDDGSAARLLAGDPGCADAADAAAFTVRRTLTFGNRPWELRLFTNARALPGAQHAGGWLFSIVGLAATSLLGMLLLTVTGRARRIELAVDERTRALTTEVQDRRAAEAALRSSEERQRNILEQMPIGVMFLDMRGNIVEANPRLCQMLHRSADELRQLSATELAHPDEIAEHRRMLRELLAGKAQMSGKAIRLRRADGSELWVRATISVLRDTGGQPHQLVGVLEDITEHLRLAESERALDAAESANRAKSEFVSRMSHELRTPLNAMLGFAQLLGMDRRPPLATHQQGWTTQIQRAGWHLLEMINDTLELSRIEAGMVQLNTQALELAPLVSASIALVANAAEKRGIRITEQLDPGARAAMADETRLKQVLTNLLSNAVKYNRDGGQIVVTTRRAGDAGVSITVRDSGLGMTRDQLGGLFQPYNRLGRETSAIEGTGIGLVISRRLAELMGGSLEAASTAGEGSAFTLNLPRATFTDSGTPISGVRDAEPPRYRRRRVHYIEDNETNVEVMRGILSQRPQIVLEVSMNGLDGLAAMRQRQPDLILLDMHLPDIGGLELLRHLKRDEALADIPVVVVSADATPARAEEALNLGAEHYLTKPVDIASLLHTLDQRLIDLETRW